jgi:RNA polymerase sigma-70 factor (ECF subfamily)
MLPVDNALARDAPLSTDVAGMELEAPVAQLRETIREHITLVQRKARSLSRNRPDAEDLAQDCFVRALTHQGDDIRNPRAYLLSMLRNAHVDRILRRQREFMSVALENAAVEPISEATQHGGLLGRDVMQSIRQLPSAQQDIVRLVCLEGLSNREAAHLLDLPVGTVLSRLARARERLQHVLE